MSTPDASPPDPRAAGLAALDDGRYEDAVPLLQRAVRRAPADGYARRRLAFALLAVGRWAEGFDQLGRPLSGHPRARFACPRWSGQPLPDATLVVYDGNCSDADFADYGEGFGDTLHFVRYLSRARERVGRLVLACHPRILPLLRGLAGVDQWCRRDQPWPSAAARAPLVLLPGLLEDTPSTIPCEVPYLPRPRGSGPRPVLGRRSPGERAVGICWRASRRHPIDARKECSLEWLLALGEIPGVRLVSLQHDATPAEIAALRARGGVHEPAHLEGFERTAELLFALDLVVTIDTATVHLAGALARPTWVLLPFAPDWRWASSVVWYPTLRRFRQPQPGAWGPVLDEVAAALRGLVAGPEHLPPGLG